MTDTVRRTVPFPKKLYDAIAALAKSDRRSFNAELEELLERAVAKPAKGKR